jgi:hypothetical protein
VAAERESVREISVAACGVDILKIEVLIDDVFDEVGAMPGVAGRTSSTHAAAVALLCTAASGTRTLGGHGGE